MDVGKMTDVARELFQIMDHISRLEWELAPRWDIKPSEAKLLGRLYFILDNGRESIKASELSRQMEITPAAVTHLINPLEDAGYIARLPDPTDRRVVLISLTDKGQEFARVLIQDANQRLAGLAEYLGEEDSRTLIRIILSIRDYLATYSPDTQ
jgi:DNA-binding MarR family transcriptional regulator